MAPCAVPWAWLVAGSSRGLSRAALKPPMARWQGGQAAGARYHTRRGQAPALHSRCETAGGRSGRTHRWCRCWRGLPAAGAKAGAGAGRPAAPQTAAARLLPRLAAASRRAGQLTRGRGGGARGGQLRGTCAAAQGCARGRGAWRSACGGWEVFHTNAFKPGGPAKPVIKGTVMGGDPQGPSWATHVASP